MRTLTLRRFTGTLAVVALALLCVTVPHQPTRGQVKEAVKPAVEAVKDATKKEKDTPLEVMIFPSDRDAKNMIKAVNDYLEEFKDKSPKAPWDKICFAAQQVLDAKSDSFYEAKTEEGKVQRISAKAEVNRLIGRFPTEGKQFYQLTFGGTADSVLNDAIGRNYDRGTLAEVSQRYFHTKAGAQATLLLAGLNLDRGNYVEAAYSFDRLIDRKDAEELLTPLNTFKAIVALQRASQNPERTTKLLAQLEKKLPRDGLKIGLKSYSFDDLKDELAKSPETLFGRVGDAYVTMRGGNASHTAVGNGGAPFLDPTFSKSMLTRSEDYPDGVNWLQQNLTTVVKEMKPQKGEIGIPAFFPLSSQGLAYIRTYDGIFAYVTKDGFMNHGKPAKPGDIYWIAEARGSLGYLMSGENSNDLKNRFQQFRDQHQFKSILFENPLVGSLTHDGQNLYAVDDIALPAPPSLIVNQEMGFVPAGTGAVQAVVDKNFSDGNQLVALNMLTGSLVWRLGGVPGLPTMTEEEEDKTDNPLLLMSNAFFVGPPMPVNGKLYVLFEKGGRMRLACLDPMKVRSYTLPNDTRPSNKAPELVWSQRLGEPQAKLPLDAVRRFQCSYLTYSDGVMICPTNAGAVVAVDVMSRSLLWARSYRSLKQPNATDENVPGGLRRIQRGGLAGVGTGLASIAQDRLRSAAPIISNGRVVFSAFDADSIECFDLRSGDLIWTHKRQAGDLYVAGVIDGKVLIVNRSSVRALNLVGKPAEAGAKDRREEVVVAWKDLTIGTPAGHGTASKGGIYYLPLADSPDGNRPEVWAIDVAKGIAVAKAVYRKKAEGDALPVMLGNLVFHEGQLLSQSPMEFTVFPLTGLKKEEMDKLLKANPNDPVGLVARGEIKMDQGSIAEAIADFKQAEKNNPPAEAARRLRDKLYSAYTELLRKDFDSGENFLDEYRGLCEVTIDATEAKDKERQIEEGFHRKKVYLELLAEGRRKQGKLDRALDHYLEFSNIGGGKQLVTISNQPSGQVRPDVWARTQIAAMIDEAKDPAARKLLDQRVAKEWAKVQNGTDLKALKEFVRSFGDHFATGREAQLLLAQKQLESNSEDEIRAAQSLLMKVWATTTDKPVAARAVESLARLMTRRGLMDDAVALYSQLGEEFGDVTIRDGKTGADFLNDLITDKRLLPYLEPTRVLHPARVKAERKSGQPSGLVNAITLEPEGAEDSPFYRRHRIQLQPSNTGDGTWAVTIVDRTNNQEVAKFTSIKMYINPGYGMPMHRIAQAKGQLLLIHGGSTVYCFDVAEKKKLWEFTTAEVKPNPNQYYSGGPIPVDLDVFMPLGQNTTARLGIGRGTVLESSLACILHKDGLTALDPLTNTSLWTRNNVNSSSLIFGDSRHIFVIEKPLDNQNTRSLIFRASDGMPVEVPSDFGALVTSSSLQRFVGRNLLVAETKEKMRVLRLYDPLTGKDLWKHEYPAGTAVMKSYREEYTGVVQENGEIQVLHLKTGKEVSRFQIDKENTAIHAKELGHPYLFADDERFYFVLNKSANANANRNYYNYYYLKFADVNGPLYCFDRNSKKRLWYTADKLLDNQKILVERFNEVPAIVAANQMQSDDGTQQWHYRTVVIDKVNGRLRMVQNFNQNNYFYSLTTDPKNAVAKLARNDLHIEISPETAAVKK